MMLNWESEKDRPFCSFAMLDKSTAKPEGKEKQVLSIFSRTSFVD